VDENGVRTLLRDMADTELPPATVDLDRAMVAGARQHRRTVMGAAGSALALVAAVGILVAVTVTSSPQPAVTPQVRATATPSSPAPMPSSAPGRFNPLIPYAGFGWLPGGYTLYAGVAQAVTTRSIQLTAAPANGSGQLVLTVDAAGACTGSVHTTLTCAGTNDSTVHMGSFSPAPAVNGRPAFWAVDTSVGGYLVWQYAPGAWASLHAWESAALQPPPGADRAMLHRVATWVRYGVGQPLTFPFWVRLPAGWTAGASFFSQGPTGTLLGGMLAAGPPGDTRAADLNVRMAVVGNCKGTPNTTLDGAPATLQEPGQDPVYQSLCVNDVDGLGVYVAVDLKPDGQPLLSGGALGLAQDLHLLGGRVAHWTTRPLR
jgi:hypothetical protein